VLTPSSNTALEPLTSALVAQLPGCSAHFSRFTVTEIALPEQALGQFDDRKILAVAELLADARVDVIVWRPLQGVVTRIRQPSLLRRSNRSLRRSDRRKAREWPLTPQTNSRFQLRVVGRSRARQTSDYTPTETDGRRTSV
jgi:hypothetical protein